MAPAPKSSSARGSRPWYCSTCCCPTPTASSSCAGSRRSDPTPEIIVISGQGTIKRALEAGQAGAFYFIEKSDLDPAGIARILDAGDLALHDERRQHAQLREQVQSQYSFSSIIGKSKKMRELFELIEAVAASDANILIQGENGTGKELIANALHLRSLRAKGPFIKINCAAIPKDLIESELFGYKKGAFTGALQDKVGLLELASGGSLMLDEIGEMPSFLQTKLLRVLQEREYRPVGSERTVKVDFRLICATNIDLEAALREGRLREDLYFRINTIAVRVAPLRERTEDVPLLCTHLVDKFNERYRKSVTGISPAAFHLLIRNRWPGNVRELENAIERAVLVAKASEIQPADLPEADSRSGEPEPRVLGAAASHAGGDREDGDRADAAADQLEQAGGRAHPRALSSDALQQDAQAQHRGSWTCARAARERERRVTHAIRAREQRLPRAEVEGT